MGFLSNVTTLVYNLSNANFSTRILCAVYVHRLLILQLEASFNRRKEQAMDAVIGYIPSLYEQIVNK